MARPKKTADHDRQIKVYSTGQLAKMLGCCQATVTKWMDRGLLKHYRLPLSTDRRVRKDDLIEFLQQHKIPLPDDLID